MLRKRVQFFFILFIGLISWLTTSTASAQIDDLVQVRLDIQATSMVTSGKTAAHAFSIPASIKDYNGVILAGSATGDFKAGFIRFNDLEGWSTWQPLTYLSSSDQDLFLAGFRSDIYRTGTAIELRFDMPAGTQVHVHEIGVFDNRIDEDEVKAAVSFESPAPKSTAQTIIAPSLIPRGEWGAESFVGSPVPLAQPSHNRMTFHHAACCGATTYEEGLASVKGIQDFHQDVRGWSDIGYHFIFDQSGRLYQGRPFLDNRTNLDRAPVLAQGAHVGGFNTGNIGVALLGCYHPPEGGACVDVMSPALRDSVTTMYAFLSEQYGVSTDNLFGHRDQGATSCPGDNNYTLLPALRSEINELIASGNQPIAFASLSAESGDDGVVQLSWAFSEVFDVVSYRIDRETETTSTTIFEGVVSGEGLEAATFTDAGLSSNEEYQYSLYAQSSTGVEQRLSSTSTSIDLMESFFLGENFPDPLTNTTTIRYYLDYEAVVSIHVFDSSGRRVSTLVNAFQEGDQWHVTSFDAGALANGTYFYRMQADGFAGIVFDQTKTLVIAR